MKHFEEGKTYHSTMYGGDYRCVRRWFEGLLEMVALAPISTNGIIGNEFERSARAMSHPAMDGVTEVRGGVCRPESCDHIKIVQTEAYGRICDLCGIEINEK